MLYFIAVIQLHLLSLRVRSFVIILFIVMGPDESISHLYRFSQLIRGLTDNPKNLSNLALLREHSAVAKMKAVASAQLQWELM